MAEILAAIKMLYEIFMGAKSLMKFVEANKDEAWFQEVASVHKRLREAQTEDEYKKLAKELRDLWGGAK